MTRRTEWPCSEDAGSGAAGDAETRSPGRPGREDSGGFAPSRAGTEPPRTPEEQAQGLMFRESLPERTGMLFLFSDNAVHRFWMKKTMIPLDMIWMDGGGKVLFVSAQTPPCRADPCPSYGPETPAASVLEIVGGKASREKIVVESVLRFEGVK